MAQKEVGHNFLARLGKKRLRPGGLTATNWLIAQGKIGKESQILEVACNRGHTAMELARTYGCHIVGIDRDQRALEQGRVNVERAGLTDLVELKVGNALKLPFEDQSFDIVINEAMLTMLKGDAKKKAVKEYLRVLKPGGCLLTHDVTFLDDHMEKRLEELRQTIHANVEPLQLQVWQDLFREAGFSEVEATYGDMTLMSLPGMLKDEGVVDTLKIMRRGLKKENRPQFLEMYRFFNQTGKDLKYIAVCSRK